MHAYDGPATLRWFANSTFDIAEAVDARVDETPDGWDARVRADAEALTLFHALGAPVTLEFPDGSAFDVELAPSRPTGADVLPSDAEPRGYGGWVEVAAFTGAPTTVDVTFTCGTGSAPAIRRATKPGNP
ncbi:hypothetical protein [Phytomonospora endophytica]|uniref:Uncharacterized protein n=1 Tax=Phytomonospora endophytica TaxID=714109 RepID=A0A841FIY9_9ACTN|nr:hypothetical protein [Phytomonospora endophytica]MBB6033117.1 hypothetical protein [Phytomonospora endophytica]GIG65343.1 hypothetical protein Pen01_16380 [Phytomonospora endophytica]